LEAARTFLADWSFVREDATAAARRILDGLSECLQPAVRAAALAAVAPPSRSTRALEGRFAAALTALVDALDRGYDRRRALGAELTTVRLQSEQDRLTGLHNRHYLERFLGSASDGSALMLCALLVDVDHLKTINDTFGHGAGDAALSTVAAGLRRMTRPDDVVVRWGGDEFLVLLPGTDPEAGLTIGRRIVADVRAATMPEPWAAVPLSVSVGVSPANPASLPLAQLDQALYAVKAAGRDAARLVIS
jgi:diguanylate cyclase (GGDEF)-like protein